MNQYSLEFESHDLAGWIWAAVIILALIEALRYVRLGRRPAAMPVRAVLVVIVTALVGNWTRYGRAAQTPSTEADATPQTPHVESD